MKRLFIMIILMIMAIMLGCAKKDTKDKAKEVASARQEEKNTQKDSEEVKLISKDKGKRKPISFEIKSNKTKIIADGKDKFEFEIIAKDEQGAIIQNQEYKVYVNGEDYRKNNFSTKDSGTYKFRFLVEGLDEQKIEIEAVDKVQMIKLSTDTTEILADGNDTALLDVQVIDQNGRLITNAAVNIYMDNQKYNTKQFSTRNSGEYRFKAMYDNKVESNIVMVKAVDKVMEIELISAKRKILANNIDSTSFTIVLRDQNKKIVSGKNPDIYMNDKEFRESIFQTDEIGEYIFYARYKDFESKNIKIKAVEVEPLELVASQPKSESKNVKIQTDIKLYFNKALKLPLPKSAVKVMDLNNKEMKIKIISNKSSRLLEIVLEDGLKYNSKYKVQISNDLEGIEKNKMKSSSTLFFTTENFERPNLIKIEKGSFAMGDEYGDLWNICRPLHKVNLDYNFYMGETEVTFMEYDNYLQAKKIKNIPDDNNWGRRKSPVINVSWYDAIAYCNWLSWQEGIAPAYNLKTGQLLDENGNITNNITEVKGYRLPTEAEWEYSARGGKAGKATKYSGSNREYEVAWYGENSGNKTHPVKQKKANELGIYDMTGNVWEWCTDGFYKYSEEEKNNPLKGLSSEFRIMRGGSWYDINYDIRVAYRAYYNPEVKDIYFGFRIAKTEN